MSDVGRAELLRVLDEHVRLTALDRPYSCSCDRHVRDATQSFSAHVADVLAALLADREQTARAALAREAAAEARAAFIAGFDLGRDANTPSSGYVAEREACWEHYEFHRAAALRPETEAPVALWVQAENALHVDPACEYPGADCTCPAPPVESTETGRPVVSSETPSTESGEELCNACMYGECPHCWSEVLGVWPEWAGEPFECACPHRVTPHAGSQP